MKRLHLLWAVSATILLALLITACGATPTPTPLPLTATAVAPTITPTAVPLAPTPIPPTPIATLTPVPVSPTAPARAVTTAIPGRSSATPAKKAAGVTKKTTLADGWVLHECAGDGFAIELPPQWQQVDLDPALLAGLIDSMAEQNSALGSVLQQQMQSITSNDLIKLIAFDLSPVALARGDVPNAFVMKQTLPMPVSLDTVVDVNLSDAEGLAGIFHPIEHQRVQTASGPAEEVRLRMKVNGPNAEQLAGVVYQYFFVTDRDMYMVNLTSGEKADSYIPLFERIGKSLRLAKSGA